ncbi:MAG: type IV pilin [Methanosarcinales archaeon]|nr:MAG: type IV pilin [Methanosarcinales archaeon]
MNEKHGIFKKDDEAVSPIIGVFLMVTMTVIMAAVITASVLFMGLPNQAPQTSIRAVSADPTLDYVKLEHMGGSDLILKDVKLIIQNSISRVLWTNLNSTTARTKAHDTLFIYTNGISDTEVYLNGDANTGTALLAADNIGSVDITGGDVIYITMIDAPSGQMIAELTLKV